MQVQGLSNTQSSVAAQLVPEAAGARGGQTPAPSPQPAGNASSAEAQAAQQAKHTPDPAEVQKAVESLNKAVLNLNHSLQFSVDEDTKIDVVKVIDINSKEVVRQIPSVEVLSIAKAIDRLQGMLIKDKA
jgi:flagellar protein FlaG